MTIIINFVVLVKTIAPTIRRKAMVFCFSTKSSINTQQQYCLMPGSVPSFYLSATDGVSGSKSVHPDTSTAPVDVRVRKGFDKGS
jgi:hypothetical protein